MKNYLIKILGINLILIGCIGCSCPQPYYPEFPRISQETLTIIQESGSSQAKKDLRELYNLKLLLDDIKE